MPDNSDTVGQLTTTFQAFMQGANLLNDVRAAALTLRTLLSTPAAAMATGSPPASGAIVLLGAELAMFLAQTIQAIDDDIDGLQKTLKSYEGTENEILGTIMAGAGALSQLNPAARPQVGPGTTPPGTTTPGTTTSPAPAAPTGPTTTVPQTTVPQTTVPQTTVPQTTVPQTTVPQTTVPQTGRRNRRPRRPQTGRQPGTTPGRPTREVAPGGIVAGAIAGATAGQAVLRQTIKGAGHAAIDTLFDAAASGSLDAVPKVVPHLQAGAHDIQTGLPGAQRQFVDAVKVAGEPVAICKTGPVK